MKSIKQIKEEKESDIRYLAEALKINDLRSIKKFREHLAFLKQCELYLETKPREEFIKDTIRDIDNRIQVYEGRFHIWTANKTGSSRNLLKIYRAKYDLQNMQSQRKLLVFISE